jgi:hypothetical protein
MGPLSLSNLLLSPSGIFAGAAALGVFGLVVWWLVRKRVTRVWLPTIRIMRLESRVLPRLVLRLPPLVAFLCYALLAATLAAFALKPRTQVYTPFEPDQTRVHVFLDLSPSTAAHLTLDDYAGRVARLWTTLKENGRVTVSTSLAPETQEPQTAVEVEALVKRGGFHRAGLRLGTAVKRVVEEIGELDRLFIVSDRDLHSWTGFNWRYLLDEMDVTFVDLTAADAASRQNVFVYDARYLSAPSAATMEWELELARRGAGSGETPSGALAGKLEVVYMGRTLGTFPWSLPAGRSRAAVRAEWPAVALEGGEGAGVSGEGGVSREAPLVFRLIVDGGDVLALDDEFRVEPQGLKQDALLVASTGGERMLEDPAGQLSLALEVLGFRVRRQDFLTQPGPAPDAYPFVALVGGSGLGVDRFCPRSIELARIAARSRQGARDGWRTGMPRVWLAPTALNADWQELCQCFARLMTTERDGAAAPTYCDSVEARSQWLGLLPSLGAKQVGGDVGDGSGAIAWHAHDDKSGLDVLAFTVPLTPSRATGLNHAGMPLLVKELLSWQGVIDQKGALKVSAWPRVDDIAERVWPKPANASVEGDGGAGEGSSAPPPPPDVAATADTPADLGRLRSTNVPLGESLLAQIEAAQLPPRWASQGPATDKQLPSKKDREDPLPWLKLAAALAVSVTGLEGLSLLGLGLLRFWRRKPGEGEGGEAGGGGGGRLLLALLASGAALAPFGSRAEARVEFNLVGYTDPDMAMTQLAREVAHRTSIEMTVKPQTFAQASQEALMEPWLWVESVASVTTPQGHLKSEIAVWIKRGGFLVIEQALPQADLERLTADLVRDGEGEGWLPLPPDHEMMRSFYLLDALPACNNEIWRGFQHDGRLAVLAIPYQFLASVKDRPRPAGCPGAPDSERAVRLFVNLTMVALATDYKKDQIHLPEILKRLR